MTRRKVRVLDGGRGLDPFALQLLLERQLAGAVEVEVVRPAQAQDWEQPSLFEAARDRALSEATAATERAQVLGGDARDAVEQMAREAFGEVRAWSRLVRGGA